MRGRGRRGPEGTVDEWWIEERMDRGWGEWIEDDRHLQDTVEKVGKGRVTLPPSCVVLILGIAGALAGGRGHALASLQRSDVMLRDRLYVVTGITFVLEVRYNRVSL